MQMLLAHKPPPIDKVSEEEICQQRPPMDEPWNEDEKEIGIRMPRSSSNGFEVGAVATESMSASSENNAPPSSWPASSLLAKGKWEKKDKKSVRKSKDKQSYVDVSSEQEMSDGDDGNAWPFVDRR